MPGIKSVLTSVVLKIKKLLRQETQVTGQSLFVGPPGYKADGEITVHGKVYQKDKLVVSREPTYDSRKESAWFFDR